MSDEVRAFSYGGGVQSTAALVLAARREINYPLFLFANVGADSEHPDTLRYVTDVAIPYAAKEGIELVELQKVTRDGKPQTLMQRIVASKRSVPIPMRMGENGAPGNRTCTAEFKIRVVEKEMKARGATKDRRGVVGLGISLDEYQRAGTPEDKRMKVSLREYPLIDLKITRQDCLNIIASAGLPTPGRSACFFCPFHSADEWSLLARRRPDLFEKSLRARNDAARAGPATRARGVLSDPARQAAQPRPRRATDSALRGRQLRIRVLHDMSAPTMEVVRPGHGMAKLPPP